MEIKTKTYIVTDSNERTAAKVLRKLINGMLETMPSEYGVITTAKEYETYTQDCLNMIANFCMFIENNKVLNVEEKV
mgnify:CR=1 FL=1